MTNRRRVLLVAHTRREAAVTAMLETIKMLVAEGIQPVITSALFEDANQVSGMQAEFNQVEILDKDCSLHDLELVMVLGGDGTILKAAEIVRETATPLMGVNLGHVGFLAESEHDALQETVARVVAKDYVVKDRLTLEVSVLVNGEEIYSTWALNEATVEKSTAEKMLEVVVEIEQRPLTSFGCDGIVISTPTGSTAYAFSAGGPVVWPAVEAILVVPLSAHALFARPLVISPQTLVAVEVLQRSAGHGVLWCDGRRTQALPPGARVEVRRSDKSVRLARLRQSSFTDRLTKKFSLPVSGWRGPDSITD